MNSQLLETFRFAFYQFSLPGEQMPQSSPFGPIIPFNPGTPGHPSDPGIPGNPGNPRSPGGPRILVPLPKKPGGPVQSKGFIIIDYDKFNRN